MSHRQTRIIVLILVVFAAAQIALWVLFENNSASTASLHDATRGVCYRVNVLRWAVNAEEIIEAVRDRTSTTYYLPPTDCHTAVEHPLTYSPPLPVTIPLSTAKMLNAHPPSVPDRIKVANGRDGY